MKSLKLFNEETIPIMGLGTGSITKDEMENVIFEAVRVGYRHFDSALLYGNEIELGKALKKCIDSQMVQRDDLFITTKLPSIGNHEDKVEHFLTLSLSNLQLDFVDLYLIHFPVGFQHTSDDDYFPKDKNGKLLFDFSTNLQLIWKSMEKVVKLGKAKSIGISNFNISQIIKILDVAEIQPAVEIHVLFQQKPLRNFCFKNQIAVAAYSPLGSPNRKQQFVPSKGITNLFSNEIIMKICERHKKTSAQVMLSFLTTCGIIVIPKSSNTKNIISNYNIHDFVLSQEEMKEIKALDLGEDGRTFIFTEYFNGLEIHPENPLRSS